MLEDTALLVFLESMGQVYLVSLEGIQAQERRY